MSTAAQLLVGGERQTGASIRSQNGKKRRPFFIECHVYHIPWLLYVPSIHFRNSVIAAVSVANIVKSSLGPVGLDKMLVDDVGVRFNKGRVLYTLPLYISVGDQVVDVQFTILYEYCAIIINFCYSHFLKFGL